MSNQTDIGDFLGSMTGGKLAGKRNKLDEVLTHFSKVGLSIKACADARHCGRAVSTLKKRARRLDLTFPDYVPRHLRPKKSKGRKVA